MLINKQNEDKKHKFEIKSKKIEERKQVQEQNSKVLLMSEENIPYIIEEQEALIAKHTEIIKSETKLLT